METIRNYLETMFLNLPNTGEVYKAKNELWQMMEDKYTELIQDGKSENEAVGIVISEFGNLDELAKDLGIDAVIHEAAAPAGKPFPLEQVKQYIADHNRHAFQISLGTLLCIISVTPAILLNSIGDYTNNNALFDSFGATLMFVLIALAVGLFIHSNIMIGKWNYLKKEAFVTDFATTDYVHQLFETYKPTYALQLTIGVILIILSVVPAILLDVIPVLPYYENLSAILLFVLVGIGVFLIITANLRKRTLDSLLHLNETHTVGGNYVSSQKEHETYSNETVATIMSVFWPTVTCLYLSVSFLTFHWWSTWVIWPIAAIIHKLIKNMLSD